MTSLTWILTCFQLPDTPPVPYNLGHEPPKAVDTTAPGLVAIVVCILWAIECVIEGNTLFEMLMGQAMVAVWVTAIFLIDQWVFRASRRRG
jgi:hypothetical protein